MPDPVLLAKVFLVAAVVAAVILLQLATRSRAPNPVVLRVGWVVGIGAGFYLGCAMLDLYPRWPPKEDQHRFLAILMPATLAVELVSAFVPRWLAWQLRLCVAAAAAPILLHNSVYLEDLAGPGSREWPEGQTQLILAGLAAALIAMWGLLALLQTRSSERAAAPTLMLACLAAGVTVMLSGYATGGRIGFPLAGAITGATLASFAAPALPNTSRYLGVGIVGLFTIVVIGRLFGSLPTNTAIYLFLAPLLAWLPEIPGVRSIRPNVRDALRFALVGVPLLLVVLFAQKKFEVESGPSGTSSPGGYEYSPDDYKSYKQ
jgi:hypothetical protein